MKQIVIGLVGGPSTGKGEISNLLEKRGFFPFSLSDILRIKAQEQSLPHTRKSLTDIANNLRAKKGASALGLEAVSILKNSKHKKIVIESIRHPEEAKILQNNLGAFIIGVTMPIDERWKLMQKRNRPGDPKTKEEFLELVKSEESETGKETDIQVGRALKEVDIIIDNSQSLEALDGRVVKLLSEKKLLI